MEEIIDIIEEEKELEITVEDEGEELEVQIKDEETELEIDVEDETQVFNLDYNHLVNKPRVNDVELVGDKSFEELGVNPMTNIEIKEIFNRVFGGN